MEYRFEQGNFADARIVRTRVFMEEQGFANEFDSLDEHPATLHVTLYDAEGALAGCARGLGAALLAETERLAREAGATEMHLHAQCRATPFYERRGYEQYGPVELDEHVEHIWMRKAL